MRLQLIRHRSDHLLKHHRIRAYCQRCYAAFEDDDELDKHHRRPVPCPINTEPKCFDGAMSVPQESMIRERIRSGTEEEQWRRIYTIIFPDQSGHAVPSPCELFRIEVSCTR
jgi:hypothetical protein